MQQKALETPENHSFKSSLDLPGTTQTRGSSGQAEHKGASVPCYRLLPAQPAACPPHPATSGLPVAFPTSPANLPPLPLLEKSNHIKVTLTRCRKLQGQLSIFSVLRCRCVSSASLPLQFQCPGVLLSLEISSPTIIYNFAFLSKFFPTDQQIWPAGSTAPTLPAPPSRGRSTPRSTCHPSQGGLLGLQRARAPDRPSLALGKALQPWVSKEGWRETQAETAGMVLSSEPVEAAVLTEYSTAVWQTHSSGAGRVAMGVKQHQCLAVDCTL